MMLVRLELRIMMSLVLTKENRVLSFPVVTGS